MIREESSQQVSRFISHWEEWGFGLWAVEEKGSGAFIGRIGLMVHDDWPEGEHKTEVGWMLARPFWGRGLATEGALASVGYGFEELGLERIISITLPGNTASRRVMGKVGLTYRGSTCWRDHDVVWYAADRREWGTGGAYLACEFPRTPYMRSSQNPITRTSSNSLWSQSYRVGIPQQQ